MLFAGVGSSGTPSTTIFDDAAATITLGTASAAFNPIQPLDTALDGKNSGGTWTLVITNASSTSSGTLNAWSLFFDRTQLGTGLGEPVADQVTASFRIFATDPNNPLSQNQWTASGPAGTINGPTNPTATKLSAGEVNDIAPDPSDPSGNTVFVAAAAGGVWKTTNFLNPNGQPTYYPLTDFWPVDRDSASAASPSCRIMTRISRSFCRHRQRRRLYCAGGTNGLGARASGHPLSRWRPTWTLLDSTTNVDGNGNLLPMNSPLRQVR